MTATQWTVNSIKDAVRATGSHWFDPDTMRFFGTRVLPTVYQGPGGVFFVTSEKPPHGPRGYTVRQFVEDGAIIRSGSVDQIATLTKRQAVAIAQTKAADGLVGVEAAEHVEEFRPISTLDQFAHDLQRHIDPTAGHGKHG